MREGLADLLAKNLRLCWVFVKAAQTESSGAQIALRNARRTYEHATELLRAVKDEEDLADAASLAAELQALEVAINALEQRQSPSGEDL
jgi:hypothetical protein